MVTYWGRTRACGVLLLVGACSGTDDAEPGGPGGGEGGAGASAGSHATGGGGAGHAGAAGVGSGGPGPRGGGGSGAGGVGAGGSGSEPSACGSTNHAAGSRVKLKLAVTAEGDVRQLGFHDTELDLGCDYRRITEGVGRCLPSPTARITAGTAKELFQDASCMGTPVYQLDSDCPSAALLVYEPNASDACADVQPRLFARGAAVDASAGTLYTRVDGVCQSWPSAPTAELFERGEEQDLAKYAAAEWGTWASAGGLALEGWLGEDGARSAEGFHDTARAMPCSPARLEDDELHCVVGDRVSARYADTACEQPLLDDSSPCDSRQPSFATGGSDSLCQGSTLYRVLAPYTARSVWSRAASCEERMLPDDDVIERYTTEPADPAEMAGLEAVPDPDDDGRLQRAHYRNAQGACFFAFLRDTQLDTACTIGPAHDGTLRCVPTAPTTITTFFSDAACTTEVLYGSPACGQYTPFARRSVTMGCEEHVEIRHVMPEPIRGADLPPLYSLTTGECDQVSFSANSTYFRIGEELAPEAMMEATIELR